jgi:hypothetical protein
MAAESARSKFPIRRVRPTDLTSFTCLEEWDRWIFGRPREKRSAPSLFPLPGFRPFYEGGAAELSPPSLGAAGDLEKILAIRLDAIGDLLRQSIFGRLAGYEDVNSEPLVAHNPQGKTEEGGARVVCHGRHMTFQLAEVAVSKRLFARILGLIWRLRALAHPTLPRECQARRSHSRREVCPESAKKCEDDARLHCCPGLEGQFGNRVGRLEKTLAWNA